MACSVFCVLQSERTFPQRNNYLPTLRAPLAEKLVGVLFYPLRCRTR